MPTKPPTKPTAAKKPPTPRGVALVERVIASVQGNPELTPNPLTEAQLDALRLPGDRPLPATLRRWLAFDASWIGLFADLKKPKLRPLTLGKLTAQEFDEAWGEACQAFEVIIPKPCLLLPIGTDSRRFLYLGEPDELGEYPVMVIDTDDVPYICVEAGGFDLYLADAFDVATTGIDTRATIVDQARRNSRGFISLGLGGDLEHVDGDAAGARLIAEIDKDGVFAENPDGGDDDDDE